MAAEDDAVQRKYQRLMAEAIGAQHFSPAELALQEFQRKCIDDPEGARAEAEAEEAITKEEEAKAEEVAEDAKFVEEDTAEDEDEGEAEPSDFEKPTSGRKALRRRR